MRNVPGNISGKREIQYKIFQKFLTGSGAIIIRSSHKELTPIKPNFDYCIDHQKEKSNDFRQWVVASGGLSHPPGAPGQI